MNTCSLHSLWLPIVTVLTGSLFCRPILTRSRAPEQVFVDDVPVITHPFSGGQPLISGAKLRIIVETTKQLFRNL